MESDVIVWDPQILEPSLSLICPKCTKPLHGIRWLDGMKTYEGPRMLYGLNKDALLVSRVFLCENQHQILSHDQAILDQIDIEQPFLLFHKCGITKELYDFILTHCNVGMSSSEIQVLWQQTQCDYSARYEFESFDYQHGYNTALKIIHACILDNYYKNESVYAFVMSNTTSKSFISMDHTFKVSANVGIWVNGQWLKICDNLFIVLNEEGNKKCFKIIHIPHFRCSHNKLI